MPCFDVIYSLEKISNLSNVVVVDSQLPLSLNFDYFSVHDFHSNVDIQSSLAEMAFSALYFNTRSLSKNNDSFCHLLDEIQNPFTVISLSET